MRVELRRHLIIAYVVAICIHFEVQSFYQSRTSNRYSSYPKSFNYIINYNEVCSKYDERKSIKCSASSSYSVIPRHVAYIVDGNGRWAEERQKSRLEGHSVGANISVEIVKATFEMNVDYITLYLFSTENWSRPTHEIDNIMFLLEKYLIQFSSYLKENKIRLVAIGQTYRLPSSVLKVLEQTGYNSFTDGDEKMVKTLILAISYGGRDDIVATCKTLTAKVLDGSMCIDDINTDIFSSFTSTGQLGIPDPDMVIRTSGERRLSNFLLWQCAYSEFFSISKYWPDMKPDDIIPAIKEFSKRKRRFGKVISFATNQSEDVNTSLIS